MSLENNSRVVLGRDLRNIVRSACTASHGWHEWRAAHLTNPDGTLRDSGSMATKEIRACAIALSVDIEAVAAANGLSVAYFDDNKATVAPKAPVAPLAPAAPVAHVAHHDASAYEGMAPADLVRDALASAEGMIGPKLFDMLASSVAPLAEAAARGPRVVTREIIRHVPVSGNAGDTGATGATGSPSRFVARTRQDTARNVFGIKAGEAGHWRAILDECVNVYDGLSSDGVPDIDTHHVWDTEALAYLCLAARFADDNHKLRHASRVLLHGPAGTGKTTSAAQFAAITGRPFVRIAFDRTTEPAELLGQRMPKAGGGTEFRAGALVTAMQIPYAVILLDEPSFLRPGAAAVLQTILDTGCVYLKEDSNRRVELAPGAIIVAADNTNLTGDETGRYADTIAQNVALQDRFAYLVKLDYLSEAQEARVLHNRTGIHMDAARAMVNFAGQTRRGAVSGQLTTGCSLRRLIAWATACVAGVPSEAAFRTAIYAACDAADRESVRGMEKASAPHKTIDAIVSGKPLDAAPATTTPAGAHAASVFGSING